MKCRRQKRFNGVFCPWTVANYTSVRSTEYISLLPLPWDGCWAGRCWMEQSAYWCSASGAGLLNLSLWMLPSSVQAAWKAALTLWCIGSFKSLKGIGIIAFLFLPKCLFLFNSESGFLFFRFISYISRIWIICSPVTDCHFISLFELIFNQMYHLLWD